VLLQLAVASGAGLGIEPQGLDGAEAELPLQDHAACPQFFHRCRPLLLLLRVMAWGILLLLLLSRRRRHVVGPFRRRVA
jgi:hypothetical protein